MSEASEDVHHILRTLFPTAMFISLTVVTVEDGRTEVYVHTTPRQPDNHIISEPEKDKK